MITYFELGKDKRLTDIVVAGSHDAGITRGKGNIRTQALDILGQAKAGVRVFDLRVAAGKVASAPGETKRVELKAFHADPSVQKNELKMRQVGGLGVMPVVRTKLKGGDWGMGLEDMLTQARNFVKSTDYANEFLILKFDKCYNWLLIAEACAFCLNDALYTGGGNINTAKLDDLKGKVVVLFSTKGVSEVNSVFKPKDGILAFKNLYDKDGGAAYESDFNGLQYFGKGGTSVAKPFYKQSQNVEKQGKLLEKCVALQNPNVIAMMYWTTTGLLESIQKRDKKMWDAPNVEKMKKLWASGLKDMVDDRNPFPVPDNSPALAPLTKKFMPNIIMIDFADQPKCKVIRGLNDLSADDLRKLRAKAS